MSEKPVGVFDSGVGGLSVLAEIRALLPNENIVYYADTANCPYGNRSPEDIRSLSIVATDFLLERGAKLIVVACNTASSAALSTLRSIYDIPFVGMVPAVKPATTATRTGKIAVIATHATVQAELFADLVAQFAEGVSVLTAACPGLVELVEAGDVQSEIVRSLLERYLNPLLVQDIDTVVLGCTHYPFLRPLIEEIVGENVLILDAGAPVARQVERILVSRELRRLARTEGSVDLFSSGDRDAFLKTADLLMRLGICGKKPLL